MGGSSSNKKSRSDSLDEVGPTRRAVLAASGAVALTGLAGCTALDGLVDRAGEQIIGTTVSAPAAFYPGRSSPGSSGSSTSLIGKASDGVQFLSATATVDSHAEHDEPQVFRTGAVDIRRVPATARAEGREIELEGWSTSGITKAQDYNSSRSNKFGSEWWVGPDDDDDDDDVDEETLVAYLADEPTIGERFTICLPDATLPGNRGSLADELTPGRVLAYFAGSYEPDGKRTPFHDRYGTQGISYDDEHCIQLDGPISLHRDISCGSILSAELDTYRTENREIVGYSTDGGAVVSGASASVDTDGKCVFVAGDGTLYEPETLRSWGHERTAGNLSASPTLVCPVTVTPADCPCPLPGLFYVRRMIHDDQVIFTGGWTVDEGALYEESVTQLFEEGPTEVARVSLEDLRSENFEDRVVEQFSRGRSEQGSGVIVDPDDDGDGVPTALQSERGRSGLNAVNVKVVGQQGQGDNSDPIVVLHKKRLALDAPLIHLAGAGELSSDEKQELIVPVAMDKGLR